MKKHLTAILLLLASIGFAFAGGPAIPPSASAVTGLGTIATVDSPVPVANGGTGATTAATGLAALGLPHTFIKTYDAIGTYTLATGNISGINKNVTPWIDIYSFQEGVGVGKSTVFPQLSTGGAGAIVLPDAENSVLVSGVQTLPTVSWEESSGSYLLKLYLPKAGAYTVVTNYITFGGTLTP